MRVLLILAAISFFGNCIRSNCSAQDRQQAASSGEAKYADRMQTSWNGQRHKTVGW